MVILKITGYKYCQCNVLIDTINIEFPILYFKGSQVDFSKLGFISVPEGCFYLIKQYIP